MQQTVSLIAGMTKVFNSSNIHHQYLDVSQKEKENKFACKNYQDREEIQMKTINIVENQNQIQHKSKIQRR